MVFRKHLCQGVSLQCVMAYHLLQVDIFNFLVYVDKEFSKNHFFNMEDSFLRWVVSMAHM